MAVTKKGRGWFQSMTKEAQKAYIAKHPNSIYAPGNRDKKVVLRKSGGVSKDQADNAHASWAIERKIKEADRQLDAVEIHIENYRDSPSEKNNKLLNDALKLRKELEDKIDDLKKQLKKLKSK